MPRPIRRCSATIEAALAKYRELYRKNPEFLRGRLDLARLLFIDKQNKESAALFDGIDIPEVPAVNEKIKVFADALKKRDAWSGSVSFGAGYDTNLNQSSGATVVRNQTSCRFRFERATDSGRRRNAVLP